MYYYYVILQEPGCNVQLRTRDRCRTLVRLSSDSVLSEMLSAGNGNGVEWTAASFGLKTQLRNYYERY